MCLSLQKRCRVGLRSPQPTPQQSIDGANVCINAGSLAIELFREDGDVTDRNDGCLPWL